jgi:hypothetical protein
MIKGKPIILFYVLSLFCGILFAQDNQIISCKISYISNENIYVDKGKNSGLNIGDTLIVKIDGVSIASLYVQYVAKNSASCSVLTREKDLHIGDTAEFRLKGTEKKESDLAVVQEVAPSQIKYDKKLSTKPFARISGGLSLQWFHYEDQSGNNLNFDQPTIRFDLKAKELWGQKYYFVIKTRMRKNQRSRDLSTGIPQEEWRNRIYSFYFSYEDLNSPLNFRIGRILSPNLRGVGYLDGGQIQHNISENLSWGIYGGLQSSWQFETSQDSLQKYGAFVNYKSGDFKSNKFTGTIAYNAVYHGQTVSRKNIYFQSSFNDNHKLYIYQSMEVDINSSWRRNKEGQDVSLTSFYLSARYKFSNTVRSGISYDNRKNYYRYETREIPIEIYDLAFRHGLNTDISLTLPNDYFTSLRLGVKKRQDDPESVYTARLSFRKRNLFYKYLGIIINLNGYINKYTEGWMPSVNISQQIPGGHYLSLNGGLNNYEIKVDNLKRSRYWLRLNGQFQFIGRTYLNGYYSHEWGDDFNGYRILAEFGYRF